MTRHQKVEQHQALIGEMERAIVALKFWPESWAVRVVLTRKAVGHGFRTPKVRRRSGQYTRSPKTECLTLRLRPTWLEQVYERGLAAVAGRFIQQATPILIPQGAEGCWSVLGLEMVNWRPCCCYLRSLVLYGGTYCLAYDPAGGMGVLLDRASALLRGDDPDVPF